MAEIFRIGEMYDKLFKGEIPLESDLKDSILQAILEHGIDQVGKQRYWSKEDPAEFLLRLNEMIEDLFNNPKTAEGERMTEKQLDFHRRIYVAIYRLRRAVKKLIKEEES